MAELSDPPEPESQFSETEIFMDAGDTKIRLKWVKGTVPPDAPPIGALKKKEPKYSHGGPPCWVFLEEIHARKVEKMQEFYRQRLRNRLIQKEIDARKPNKTHALLLEMVGPEWYQELSPFQLKTVDNLKISLTFKDEVKRLESCRQNILDLGIIPVPSIALTKKVIDQSCKNPVQFFLILYQLMSPKRESYSLNDRLLLSAVVHLTMKQTLKEMHVRIPSPPPTPPPKIGKEVKNRKKKIEYDSPYLVPFTFQPKSRKYSGIYKNKHVQYPDNMYFSYNLKEINKDLQRKYPLFKHFHKLWR